MTEPPLTLAERVCAICRPIHEDLDALILQACRLTAKSDATLDTPLLDVFDQATDLMTAIATLNRAFGIAIDLAFPRHAPVRDLVAAVRTARPACPICAARVASDPGTACRPADPIAPYQITATAYPDEPEADTAHLMAVLTEIANGHRDVIHDAADPTEVITRIGLCAQGFFINPNAQRFRHRMQIIAALCVAAALAWDRTHPGGVSGAACQEA